MNNDNNIYMRCYYLIAQGVVVSCYLDPLPVSEVHTLYDIVVYNATTNIYSQRQAFLLVGC